MTEPEAEVVIDGKLHKVVSVTYGQTPEQVREQAAALVNGLARELRAELKAFGAGVDLRLARHEQAAAEAAAKRAAELDQIRAALVELAKLPATTADLVDELAKLRESVEDLDGRTVAVEDETARAARAAEEEERYQRRRREERAEERERERDSRVGPSPLIVHAGTVAAAPIPSTSASAPRPLLERIGLPPAHAVAMAFAVASALAGQAIPWPQLIAAVAPAPSVQAPHLAPSGSPSPPSPAPPSLDGPSPLR